MLETGQVLNPTVRCTHSFRANPADRVTLDRCIEGSITVIVCGLITSRSPRPWGHGAWAYIWRLMQGLPLSLLGACSISYGHWLSRSTCPLLEATCPGKRDPRGQYGILCCVGLENRLVEVREGGDSGQGVFNAGGAGYLRRGGALTPQTAQMVRDGRMMLLYHSGIHVPSNGSQNLSVQSDVVG